MAWHGRLTLDYTRDDDAPATPTALRFAHVGPLRILKSLHPEGPAICHNVIVHPPGGLVGGDRLDIAIALGPRCHALLTTPGATRYYRSAGAPASQAVQARLAPGSRLEWLPLETLVHSGALAESRLRFELDAGAEMFGLDLVALGLPASDQAFLAGHYRHEIALPGRWLDAGLTDARDATLLDGGPGWAGRRVMGTLWFAAGSALPPARRDALLDAARARIDADPLAASAGATSPHAEIVLARVLAPRVEPAFALLADLWRTWRPLAWSLPATPPRVWRC